jgi:2',3'-cyclic-nucleotide 2'-phosphodiesterase (5'-nucleotidase family)
MVAGRPVGIIGLTNAQQASIGDFSITDPVEAARKAMAEVRQQTNVVIVLSHLGLQQDEMLGVAVPGIALIVGGHSRTLLMVPRKQEGSPTLIVQAGYQGEFIGRVQLHIASDGKMADSTGTVIPLTTDFADDPAMRAWLDGRRQAP